MTAKLYSLKSTTAFSLAVCGGPVYLRKINRTGLRTTWSPDAGAALKLTAAERDKLRERYPVQTRGRWVLAR